MESDYDNEYAERIGYIFQRLSNMNKDTQDERASRYRQTLEVISRFESTLQAAEKDNMELVAASASIVAQLKEEVKEQQKKMDTNSTLLSHTDNEIVAVMKRVSISIKQSLARHEREAALAEKSIRDRIKNRLAKLTEESQQLQKSQVPYSLTQEEVLEEYRTFLEVAGPQLMREIKGQKAVREEIESRILEQFEAQIDDLQELIRVQSQLREKEEQELVRLIKDTSHQITAMLHKQTSVRKDSEMSLAKLLETVVDKIRHEILN